MFVSTAGFRPLVPNLIRDGKQGAPVVRRTVVKRFGRVRVPIRQVLRVVLYPPDALAPEQGQPRRAIHAQTLPGLTRQAPPHGDHDG